MTATVTGPVTPAAPARPAPAPDAGGSDSAEPFASALDGAMSAGRAPVDGAGAEAGGDAPAGEDEAADGTTPAATEPAAPTAGGVVAALWALLTGAAPAGDAAARATAATAPGTDGLPPGLAVAQAHGGRAVAHGVHGTQPGQLPAAAPAVAADPTAPAVPAAGAPAPPPPVDAAARAAAEALAAVGVTQLVTEAPAPVDVPVAAAAAPIAAATATGDDAAATPAPAPSPSPVTALPVAAPAPSGGASADAGADGGSRDDGSAAPDAVQTSGPAAPAAPTTSVHRSEATTGAAVAHPVSNQIARSVAVLRGAPDGSHTMTVVLTPEALGPVQVSVTVHKGAIELTLRGAHEHGHAALLDAVPDLRRDLEAAGLTCSRLDVDRGSRDGAWSSSQQQAGRPGEQGQGSGRGSHGDRGETGARPWHRSADRGDGHRTAARTATGLDVRV